MNVDILDFICRSAWIRMLLSQEECGHSYLFASTNGLVRRKPSDNQQEIINNLDFMQHYFADLQGGNLSIHAPISENELLDEFTKIASVNNCIISEGYVMNSSLENSNLNLKFKKIGKHKFILSIGKAADFWNEKTNMRKKTRELLGELAVPHGIEVESKDLNYVKEWAEIHKHLKRIIKVLGAGGYGNIILFPHEVLSIKQLKISIENTESSWVSCELWSPWSISGAVSFFIDNEQNIHDFLVGVQILKPNSTFSGTSSYVPFFQIEDQLALVNYAQEIIKSQVQDGIRGFSGMDWILLKDGYKGLSLPSGKQIQFVEANARVNAQNHAYVGIAKILRNVEINPREYVYYRTNFKKRPKGINTFEHCLNWLDTNGYPTLRNGQQIDKSPILFPESYEVLPGEYDSVVGFAHKDNAPELLKTITSLRKQDILY